MPVVELRSPRLNPDAPWVGVDNHAMGQIVADHLMQRGFRHFGVYELGTESYFEERRSNFVDTVTAAGYRCSTYQPAGPPEEPLARERHQEALSRWVRSLPKPVGIMACTDQLGFFLLEACARAGIVVPEEVAVVGVENEESLCTMAVPMLSSVQFDAERIGYEAAAVLARLMRGEAPPAGPQLIEPLGGVVRGSSGCASCWSRPISNPSSTVGRDPEWVRPENPRFSRYSMLAAANPGATPFPGSLT
jgi:LacI family transcriptional regulator